MFEQLLLPLDLAMLAALAIGLHDLYRLGGEDLCRSCIQAVRDECCFHVFLALPRFVEGAGFRHDREGGLHERLAAHVAAAPEDGDSGLKCCFGRLLHGNEARRSGHVRSILE